MRTNPKSIATTLLLAIAAGPLLAASGDYDGDGRSDVFWRNFTTGANTIWKSGSVATPQVVARVTNLNWHVAGKGDFDGDGRSDVLWRNLTTGANTIWKSGNASTPQAVAGVTNQSWFVAGVGDFDGDGKSDVFWRNSSTGANTIWKSANASTRQVTATVLPDPVNGDWNIVGVGDFDGNGRSDVLWRHGVDGAGVIWKSGNASTRQAVADFSGVGGNYAGWRIAGVGDFDGDGRSDLFWRNVQRGANVIWLSANDATQQSAAGVSNLNWTVVGVGDFDGDGKADVFWRQEVTGANAIWKSGRAATQQSVAAVTNWAWDVVPYEAQPLAPWDY